MEKEETNKKQLEQEIEFLAGGRREVWRNLIVIEERIGLLKKRMEKSADITLIATQKEL